MKTTLLMISMLITVSTLKAQYTYKPAQQPQPTYPNYYPTTPTYSTPPQSTYTPPQQKIISICNKTMEAKEVQLYVKNLKTYEWDYLQTIRIPGGETISYAIGQYEMVSDYGYRISGSYSNYINPFSSYPVNLY